MAAYPVDTRVIRRVAGGAPGTNPDKVDQNYRDSGVARSVMPVAVAHMSALESEAITIIREVAAEFENPVLLFSGGKDSVVMLHLAVMAFHPARIPFPIMHVDTGH